jgi:hypothetical protein
VKFENPNGISKEFWKFDCFCFDFWCSPVLQRVLTCFWVAAKLMVIWLSPAGICSTFYCIIDAKIDVFVKSVEIGKKCGFLAILARWGFFEFGN